MLGVGAALGFLAQSSSFLKAQLAGRCGSPTNQRGRAMGTEVGAARVGVCLRLPSALRPKWLCSFSSILKL